MPLPASFPDGERHEVLRAASYVLWADHRVTASEVAALREIATVLGLPAANARLSELLGESVRLVDLDPAALAPEARRVAVAAAAWIALADGELHPLERTVLGALAQEAAVDSALVDLLLAEAGALRHAMAARSMSGLVAVEQLFAAALGRGITSAA